MQHKLVKVFSLSLIGGVAACSAPDRVLSTSGAMAHVQVASEQASGSQGEGDEASDAARLDLRIVRSELLATDQAYAEAATHTNLVEALVAPLGPEAVFVAPGPGLVRGPEAARKLLKANPVNLSLKWHWVAIKVDVSSDGNRGYTFGYTELVLPSGAVSPGRYEAYWARQSDGSWKMAAYRRTGRAPGAVALTPPSGFETPTAKHYRYFPNTDSAMDRDVVADVDRAFSNMAQSRPIGEAFAMFVAEDGAQGAGGAEWSFGAQQIAAAHPEPAGAFSWSPQIVDVAASGDLAFSVGFVYAPNGAIAGKYLTVWKRQKDGAWRYVVD